LVKIKKKRILDSVFVRWDFQILLVQLVRSKYIYAP
jgi:hypothetical protein